MTKSGSRKSFHQTFLDNELHEFNELHELLRVALISEIRKIRSLYKILHQLLRVALISEIRKIRSLYKIFVSIYLKFLEIYIMLLYF